MAVVTVRFQHFLLDVSDDTDSEKRNCMVQGNFGRKFISGIDGP
jgi:hypothetical protein